MRRNTYFVRKTIGIFLMLFAVVGNAYATYSLDGKATVREGSSVTVSMKDGFADTFKYSGTRIISYKWYTSDSHISILSYSPTSAVVKGLSPTSTPAIVYYDCSYDIDGFYRTFDFYYEVTVTANAVKVTRIELMSGLTINVGMSYPLLATPYPENATNKTVSWYSDNNNIVSVSNSGVVTGKSIGSTYVRCYANDGGGASASCWVVVYPVTATNINLSQSTLNLMSGRSQHSLLLFYP